MVLLTMNVKRSASWFRIMIFFPVFKSSITSNKLTTFSFASTVIFWIVVRKYLAFFFCFPYLPWCLIEHHQPFISVKSDFDAGDLLCNRT